MGCKGIQRALHKSFCMAVRYLVTPGKKKKKRSLLSRRASLSSACCLGFELFPLSSPGNAPCPAGWIKMPSSARVPFCVQRALLHLIIRDRRSWSWSELRRWDWETAGTCPLKHPPKKDFLPILPSFFLWKAPVQTYSVSGNGISWNLVTAWKLQGTGMEQLSCCSSKGNKLWSPYLQQLQELRLRHAWAFPSLAGIEGSQKQPHLVFSWFTAWNCVVHVEAKCLFFHHCGDK